MCTHTHTHTKEQHHSKVKQRALKQCVRRIPAKCFFSTSHCLSQALFSPRPLVVVFCALCPLSFFLPQRTYKGTWDHAGNAKRAFCNVAATSPTSSPNDWFVLFQHTHTHAHNHVSKPIGAAKAVPCCFRYIPTPTSPPCSPATGCIVCLEPCHPSKAN